MKIIKGNKTEELNKTNLATLIHDHEKVILDLGTGDGRFVYKTASKYPNNLVIGIDPSQKQLEIYSKRANKNKVENALFVVGSVEVLPEELINTGDEVYINFPWGSLLGGISGVDEKIIKNISSLVKPGGKLEIVLGYSQEAEPSEIKRLKLDQLDERKIQNEIIPEFEKNKLQLSQLSNIHNEEYFKLDSSGGKKLTFGKEREIYKLVLIK